MVNFIVKFPNFGGSIHVSGKRDAKLTVAGLSLAMGR
jgi:hypothetical protein